MFFYFKALACFIAELEIWVVGLAVLASMALTPLLPVALVIALMFWPVRWLAYGRPSIRTSADWPILILFFMAIVTIWVTALPWVSIPQVFRLLTGIAIFYAIVNWVNIPPTSKGLKPEDRLRLLTILIVAAGVLLAFLAIFTLRQQTAKLFLIPDSIYKLLPTWGTGDTHPNVMAGTLDLLLPLGLSGFAFISWKRHPWQKVYYGITAFIIGSIILLTQSRGALLAVSVILVGLICLRWRYGWLSLIGIVMGGVFFIQLWGINAIMDFLSAGISLAGFEGRIEVWSRGVYMIRDFPITGIGMGTFEYVAGALYPFFVATSEVMPHVHNLLLQIAIDLGLPGLTAWLAILVSVGIAAGRIYSLGWRKGRSQVAAIGAGLLLSQFALIVHGFLDAVTWGMVRPAPFVWAGWGMAMAAVGVYDTKLVRRD
jgi:putative inorganic carbon (HCO3(-)) transporter